MDEMLSFMIVNGKIGQLDRAVREPIGFSLGSFLREYRKSERNERQDEEESKFIIEAQVFIELSKELMGRGCSLYQGHDESSVVMQHAFNQSVYDALNEVIDFYRPYGTRGRPILRGMVTQSSSAIQSRTVWHNSEQALLAFCGIRAGRMREIVTDEDLRLAEAELFRGLEKLLESELEWDCFKWGSAEESEVEMRLQLADRVTLLFLEREVQALLRELP
jgi:hypothetical protein